MMMPHRRFPISPAGGRKAAEAVLAKVDPRAYAASRNHLDGAVTRLSPYIRHGVLSLDEVRNAALASVGDPKQAEKFIQELAWRDYWQRIYLAHPERVWTDVESYKTGFDAAEYDAELPADIAAGETGVACIDQFIATLVETGYLHNHARMYLASYTVHWRRVSWQAGARFLPRASGRCRSGQQQPVMAVDRQHLLEQALYLQSRECREILRAGHQHHPAA
ncbi:MAG: hypothetical protein CM15mP60_2240 [Alphaproteobacteria bacterium]|nr:MAG: hypothetical protein CM15mP60_2240 [Alphaproteobacteria bacterium]